MLDIGRGFLTSDPVIVRAALFGLRLIGRVSARALHTQQLSPLTSFPSSDGGIMSRRKPELQAIGVKGTPRSFTRF